MTPDSPSGTLAELTRDPHPLLARLREREPVSWVPELGAWLVTGYDLAVEVLRDARTFTVDDPRFTTARVTGPSMLSLDGAAHARHRGPFANAFRPAEISRGLAGFIEAEAARLVAEIRPAGQAELRRSVAGPLAAAVMGRALGLTVPPGTVLSWYDGIVTAVSGLAGTGPADAAADGGGAPVQVPSFTALAASLREAIRPGRGNDSLLARAAAGGGLDTEEIVSNAGVLLFGGIETTEGMISNAVLHLLSHPAQLELVRAEPALLPGAVEESLRLEPAAAVVDRYATADTRLGGAPLRAGDPVTVSIAGANRDPRVFAEPDRFDVTRPNASRHLAFAHGPHFCLGAHVARLETSTAVATVLGLPGLRLDPGHDSAPRGLVFRKPPELRIQWESRCLPSRNRCLGLLRRAITGSYRLGMVAIKPAKPPHRGSFAALLAIACIGTAAAAGCSSSSSTPSAGSTPSSGAASPTASKPTGTVSVAYASSLQYLNEKVVFPAFTAAQGYSTSGRGASSGDLEADIASGEISPNVFEAVGGDNITPLQPKFTKWYIQYAGTSMVVAYNPHSKYASQFKAIADGSKPLADLFTLLQTPGLKLGRTDPNVDPQGRDFIYMLELAQSHFNLPSDTTAKILGTSDFGTANSSQIYAESSLDATLQSGQLDAASAFVTQAIQLHLDYIPLPAAINLGSFALAPQYKKASVTLANGQTKHGSPQVIDITIIGTPTPAATSFVKYTLSAPGVAQYREGGFTILTPTVFGTASAVPSEISSELGS